MNSSDRRTLVERLARTESHYQSQVAYTHQLERELEVLSARHQALLKEYVARLTEADASGTGRHRAG